MPRGPAASRLPAAAAIVLIAFNLRPALSSLGPVLAEVMQATGLTGAGASLMTTLPVLCLGLFSPVAPWLARRIGPERTIQVFLGAMVIGMALRGADGIPALFVGSLVAGAGIGMGNALMPAILKRDFSDRAPLITGVYTMALCAGAAVASGATAPLYRAFGESWAAALSFWAAPAALAMVVAAVVWPGRAAPPSGARRRISGLWRDPVAWQVTFFMGLQSMLAYVVFGWMAPILRSRGDAQVTAGLVVSVSIVFQVAASLPAPIIAARMRTQSGLAVLVMALTAGSFLGLLTLPLAWQWVLAALLGMGMGGAFSLAIMMIVLRAKDGPTAAMLSSMAQGIGYTLASAGPLIVGLLHDMTGDWRGAAGLFVVASLGAAIAGGLAGRRRMVGMQAG